MSLGDSPQHRVRFCASKPCTRGDIAGEARLDAFKCLTKPGGAPQCPAAQQSSHIGTCAVVSSATLSLHCCWVPSWGARSREAPELGLRRGSGTLCPQNLFVLLNTVEDSRGFASMILLYARLKLRSA